MFACCVTIDCDVCMLLLALFLCFRECLLPSSLSQMDIKGVRAVWVLRDHGWLGSARGRSMQNAKRSFIDLFVRVSRHTCHVWYIRQTFMVNEASLAARMAHMSKRARGVLFDQVRHTPTRNTPRSKIRLTPSKHAPLFVIF